MNFDHIPPFYETANDPRGVSTMRLMPRGGRNKFALKDEFGVMELRRIVPRGLIWPCDFGFVPQTLGEDGDALDVALMIDAPCFPGCLVRARVLGVIGLIKNGEQNDRLLACPISLSGSASEWDELKTLKDVSGRAIREIETFLRDYQTFEGNQIELTGIGDENAAMELVRAAHRNWKEKQDVKDD